jgi:hypothetical protein
MTPNNILSNEEIQILSDEEIQIFALEQTSIAEDLIDRSFFDRVDIEE